MNQAFEGAGGDGQGDRGALHRIALPALLIILALAAFLRFYGLGDWSLADDEINTLRDTLAPPGLGSSRPLFFWLNAGVTGLLGVNETTMRLLPAVFGTAGVAAMYLAGDWVENARVGLLAAAITALNPWHLYWSQFSRYYTLVFLLTALYMFVLYRGLSERKWTWVVAGILLAVLAVFSHPSAGLALPGIAIWMIYRLVKRGGTSRYLIIIAGVGAVIAVLVAVRLWPLLVGWYRFPQDWGHSPPALMLSYAGALVPAVSVAGAAGLIWLWLAGERSLAAYLVLMIGVPLVVLGLASALMPVSTGYLFATAPVVLLSAAIFVDRLARVGPRFGVVPLASATVLVMLFGAMAPGAISQYMDGGRADFRGAARFLGERTAQGSPIFADQSRAISYYLEDRAVKPIPEGEQLAEALRGPEDAWIVLSAARRAGFNDRRVPDTLLGRCIVSDVIGASRLDYRYNGLIVLRCPREQPDREPGGPEDLDG